MNFRLPNRGANALGFNLRNPRDLDAIKAMAKAGGKIVRIKHLHDDDRDAVTVKAVNHAKALGMQVVLLLTDMPVAQMSAKQHGQWANLNKQNGSPLPYYMQSRFCPIESTGTWWQDEFVRPIGKLLGRRVLYECWNEPNRWQGMMALDAHVNVPVSPSLPALYRKLMQVTEDVLPRGACIGISSAWLSLDWWAQIIHALPRKAVLMPHLYQDGTDPFPQIAGLAGLETAARRTLGRTVPIAHGEVGWMPWNDAALACASESGRNGGARFRILYDWDDPLWKVPQNVPAVVAVQ